MPNQEQSRNGNSLKDQGRLATGVGGRAADGQASVRGSGEAPDSGGKDSERPLAGPEKALPKTSGSHSTQDERGAGSNTSDAGAPGAPGGGMSDCNGPGDPDAKRNR